MKSAQRPTKTVSFDLPPSPVSLPQQSERQQRYIARASRRQAQQVESSVVAQPSPDSDISVSVPVLSSDDPAPASPPAAQLHNVESKVTVQDIDDIEEPVATNNMIIW